MWAPDVEYQVYSIFFFLSEIQLTLLGEELCVHHPQHSNSMSAYPPHGTTVYHTLYIVCLLISHIATDSFFFQHRRFLGSDCLLRSCTIASSGCTPFYS
jgi:hypothetical protein